MNEFNFYTKEIEKYISEYIDNKFKEDELLTLFPNKLLREDVLDLLDRYCKVLYYPLENEKSNNGFHLTDMPIYGEGNVNFVFINTAQTIEKQIFTAAHELGHIWRVDEYIITKLKDVEYNEDNKEKIINRFAAVLLIPKDIFIAAFKLECRSYFESEKNILKLKDLLRIIVDLMNLFFVPSKAIVYRLSELNVINDEDAQFIINNCEKEILQIISDCGYTKFQVPSFRKWIDDIANKLDLCESEELLTKQKIEDLRNKFDLKPKKDIEKMEDEIKINSNSKV